jgi:PEP-CTERM motif
MLGIGSPTRIAPGSKGIELSDRRNLFLPTTNDSPSEESLMMKRSYFLALAAGLFANLAFATASQAGEILVDTTASFTLTSPAGATASDFTFTYNSTAISDLTLVSAPAGSTISSDGVSKITIDLSPPSGGPASFEWTFKDPGPGPIGVVTAFEFSGAPVEFGATTEFEVTNQAVPEPASFALVGIGLTGILAFRRFFKKTLVA